MEEILYNRMQSHLQTTRNKFGFKPKHWTVICVYLLKELLRYYVKDRSCRYVAYCDASKIFHRATKLFSKLLKLGVSKYLTKVICHWHCNHTTCVKWGSVISNFFSVNNGVRQGGMLSPFILYMTG